MFIEEHGREPDARSQAAADRVHEQRTEQRIAEDVEGIGVQRERGDRAPDLTPRDGLGAHGRGLSSLVLR